jgi:hypothetical protein
MKIISFNKNSVINFKLAFWLIIIIIFAFLIFSCDESEIMDVDSFHTPNNPNPPNGSVIRDDTLTLKWECDDASNFDVLLDTINPPTNVIIERTSINSKQVSGLKFNRQYYWQVIAHYPEKVIYSDIWMFEILDADSFPIPNNPNPPNGSVIRDDTVTLKWECEEAISYIIEYDRGELCCSNMIESIDNHQKLAGLFKESSYNWTVKAIFPNGYTSQSDTWIFNVSDYDSISPITEPIPQNGALLSDINTPIDWNCTGGFIYYIYIGTDSMAMKKVLTLDYIGNEFKNLEYDKTYYWQVVVKRGSQLKKGPVWNFRTPLSPASLSIVMPTNIVQVKYYHVYTDQYGTSTGTDTVNWSINYLNWNQVNSDFKSFSTRNDTIFYSMNSEFINAGGYIAINQISQTLSLYYEYNKNLNYGYYSENISYLLELRDLPFLINGRNVNCAVSSNELMPNTHSINFTKSTYSSSEGLQHWGFATLLNLIGYSSDQTLIIIVQNFFRED